MHEQDLPRWLDPRIWGCVLALGLLGLAAGVLWEARSMNASPSGFSGPITHHAPTNAFTRDQDDVPDPPDYESISQLGFHTTGLLKRGEAKVDSFPLESSPLVALFVSYPDGDLDFELTSPSGRLYGDQSSAPGSEIGESPEGLFGLGPGRTLYVGIEHPEPGMWKSRVSVKAMPDTMTAIPYVLATMIKQGVSAAAVRNLTPRRTHQVRETATIIALVTLGDEPVTDAKVAGILSSPVGGRNVTFYLKDDGNPPDSVAGDGKYSGRTPPLESPGNPHYSILASRMPSNGRPGFDHTTGGMLSISRSRSHWTGRFRDFGADTTGDGQFDQLILEAEVEVTHDCQLEGYAILEDSEGRRHRASFFNQRLRPGKHAIPFAFDGQEIFDAGKSGSYTLTVLRMSEMEAGLIALLDELKNAYRTRSYERFEFQHEPYRIVRLAGIEGLNPGHDGKFRTLAVDVEIEVDSTHHLQVGAWLGLANRPDWLGITSTTVGTYRKGKHVVRLFFPGGCVSRYLDGSACILHELEIMGGPSMDMPLPAIDPKQYGGPHQFMDFNGMMRSECPPDDR